MLVFFPIDAQEDHLVELHVEDNVVVSKENDGLNNHVLVVHENDDQENFDPNIGEDFANFYFEKITCKYGDNNVQRCCLPGKEVASKERLRSRKACPEKWRRNRLVKAVATGEVHCRSDMKSKKIIQAKKFTFIDCKCKFRCAQHIPVEQQKELFDDYWAIGCREKQRLYLATLLSECAVKRRTVCEPKSFRSVSVAYHLHDAEGRELIRVCRKFFCSTFAISDKIPKNIVHKKSPTSGRFNPVHKNKAKQPWNKTPDKRIRIVNSFLNSIPKVPSHYCRKETKKLYFEPSLNIRKLYDLYREQEKDNDPVSFFVFNSIFHDYEPQLSFFIPRKDQCTKCNAHDVRSSEWPTDREYEDHVLRKDIISVNKAADKANAVANSKDTLYVTFDLEAILSLPHSEDSVLYYSRKLSMFNFTIHNSQNQGICNMWTESEGRKGSNEIGTCLMQYFSSLHPDIKHVIMYSDTCSGQNRNQYIVAALLLCQNTGTAEFLSADILDLKYLETGHSMMECDSMHSAIERAKKYRKVYSPEEYEMIASLARQKPYPYQVKRMQYSDFFDLHKLAEKCIHMRTKDSEGETVQWLKIKWFRFIKGSRIVYFKYDVEEEDFRCLHLVRDDFDFNSLLPLEKAYNEPLPISVKKKRDLVNLLQKGAIPATYRDFYSSLPSSPKVKDVAHWIDYVLEEEIQEEVLALSDLPE